MQNPDLNDLARRPTVSLEQRLPVTLAVGMSLAFLALSVRHRAPHFLAFAAVIVATTIATASLVSGWASISWMFVALGTACATFGGAKLMRFVRANPVRTGEGM